MRARIKRPIGLIGLIGPIALAGCVSPYSFEAAVKDDTADAYRRFIEDSPGDINVQPAYRRLAEIEFNDAVKAGSIWGFKKFLRDYPDAAQAEAARKYLEELRFAKARREDTRQEYLTFLSFHPDGDLADKARAAIMRIEYEAIPAGDGAALKKYVAFYPDSPQRAEAEARLDDAEFESAKRAGEAGLLEYVAARKGGPHGQEARALAMRAGVARAIDRCRVKRAGALVDEMRHDPALTAVAAEFEPRVAAARTACADRKALLTLDPAALKKLAAGKGPHAGAAAAALSVGASRPRDFKDLKTATAAVTVRGEAGTLASLRALAASNDPLARLRAATLARFVPKGGAVDLALRLLADTYVPVRHAAAESLVAMAGTFTPAAIERIYGRRITRLEAQARDAPLYFKVGVLYEARGLKADALSHYRKAALADRYDPYLLYRLMSTEAAAGEGMKALAAYGQFVKLVVAAMAEREQIWNEKPALPKEAVRATAAQYCGMLSLLRSAEALSGGQAAAARDTGKDEKAVWESAKGQIAAGASFVAKAAAILGKDERAICGGDGGAREVAKARDARRQALDRLITARPPWLGALLASVVDFEPDPAIRNSAEQALRSVQKPEPEGAK